MHISHACKVSESLFLLMIFNWIGCRHWPYINFLCLVYPDRKFIWSH